jgi:hypothetical protein
MTSAQRRATKRYRERRRRSGLKRLEVLSALDAFVMKEALSPQGEALWKDVMRQIERDRKDPLL